MQQINGQFYDLTDEEIDKIQETLEYDEDSEVDDFEIQNFQSYENNNSHQDSEESATYENNGSHQDSEENATNGAIAMNAIDSTTAISNGDEISTEPIENNGELAESTTNKTNGANKTCETTKQIDSIQSTAGANSSDEHSDGDESSFQWLYSSTDDHHLPLDSKISVELFEKTYENITNFGRSTLNATNGNSNGDEVLEEGPIANNDDSNGNTFNEVNAETSDSDQNAASSGSSHLVRIKNEKRSSNHANYSGNTPIFSPPSTSSSVFSGQIPAHLARADPSLYNLLNTQGKPNEAQSQMSSIQDLLDQVSSVFPVDFTYVR